MSAPDLLDWRRSKEAEGHYIYQWHDFTIHLWTEPGAAELWRGDEISGADAEGDIHWLAQVAAEVENA